MATLHAMEVPVTLSRTDTVRQRDAYRLMRRWQFYADAFCLPFVLWLACAGLIYLFEPQVEPWLDRAYARVEDAPAKPVSAQVPTDMF